MADPHAHRPARPLADTVWWWTVVTLLVVYLAAWIDEQPGFATRGLAHLLWTLVLVWPAVLVAGVVAGRSVARETRAGWAAWLVAGLWTLVAGGALAFWGGDLACRDSQNPDCLADGTTRLAVAASAGAAWAAAEWLSIVVRRREAATSG